MIIHKLILQHLRRSDDLDFYELQAVDAVRWIKAHKQPSGDMRVLDLGAGCGLFGSLFARMGCQVTYADEANHLAEHLKGEPFIEFRIGRDELHRLGEFDLVLFSNVLEHIDDPESFIRNSPCMLRPGGMLFCSWTNWLSPWGGHDFSPFHYLGPKLGPWLNERVTKRKTIFTMGKDLYPTYIGRTLRWIRSQKELNIVALAPRYYTELSWLAYIPVVREFLCWNMAVLIRKGAAT